MAGGPAVLKRKAMENDCTIGCTTPIIEGKEHASRRKKQAVTKTNSAAVRALIRQNQAESPLLKLVPEIREKILTYLVGAQVIHVHLSNPVISRSAEIGEAKKSKKPKPVSILCHICQEDTPRAHAYYQARANDAEAPDLTMPEYYVVHPNKGHDFCRYLATIKKERLDSHLSLNVSGVCRQLYEETNYLLWSTNTFTFDKPKAFRIFFGSLNPAQKRKLTKLALFVTISPPPGCWSFDWEKALRPRDLKMLQGLRTLSLDFDQRVEAWGPRKDDEYQHLESYFGRSVETFLQFRMLPLKRVFVTVSDNVVYRMDAGETKVSNRNLCPDWTAMQRLQFARELEEELIDPDPVATIEMEEDAAELDAQEASERHWAQRLDAEEQEACLCEVTADAAAASLEEANLESARIPSFMEASIEDIIEQRKAKAMSARAAATSARARFEKSKDYMPHGKRADAVVRKAQREDRRRHQMMINPKATASTQSAPS